MMKLVASPRISRAIEELRSIPENHHNNVLTPLEKYCVDQTIDKLSKRPLFDLYLKSRVYEKLS